MTTSIVDISYINIKELIKDMEEEEVTLLLKQAYKKQLLELKVVEDKKKIESRKK